MTHLKKTLPSDAKELYNIPNIRKKSFYAEFENGHLIALDTKDQTLINFAKAKGLKN